MKKLLFMLFFFCFGFNSPFGGWGAFAQNPLVKMWDNRLGGTDVEYLNSFHQTSDGGFIMGGRSFSGISGDKSELSRGLNDYWIVKLDSLGNKEWDKCFGGSNIEECYATSQTKDGGYIVGGVSLSGATGDKTQPSWDTSTTIYDRGDYWIVKTDSLGNKQWDKRYGGWGDEFFTTLIQTKDNGYLVGGLSLSGINGDKTEPTQGSSDYWIVKTDSLGITQWDKDFGGSSLDDLTTAIQTSDNGYLLGGASWSGISGDKTQANWDTTGNYPSDFWIVKTDSLGNKLWDKSYGGNKNDVLYSAIQTHDGGYILVGTSNSDISGDKTQSAWNIDDDYWIVKIDSVGNKQWDKRFGGTFEEDGCENIIETKDGGYLVTGHSYSNAGGDKSEDNLGGEQTWIVKTDSLGNKMWDKTIFTGNHDENSFAVQTKDGCYAIANWDYHMDSIAGYNTDPGWGNGDYWIVKFCETSSSFSNFITTNPFVCPGSCLNFNNFSLNATSYQWNFSGASPDTSTDVNPQNICYANPGTYDVQLIATNANGSDTLTLANYITVYPTPPPQSITQNGDTLFAIAGATTYQWYFNTTIINGATNYFYVADTSGDYNVVATDANGCEVEAAVFNVIAAAPPVLPEGEVITAAPNPVEDKLGVRSGEFGEAAVEISVYNIIGENVLAVYLTSNLQLPTSIDVSALPSGIYWLEVNSVDKTFRTKFVKQ